MPGANTATRGTIATLQAQPDPIDIDLDKLAVVVIDMQNAFVSEGGMFDLWGIDISRGQEIVAPIRRILDAARGKGCRIVYTQAAYSADLRETGGPNSPGWFRSRNPVTFREDPDHRDRLTLRGTWGAEIIEPLKPHEGDVIIEKHKYSAFYGTYLDTILTTYGVKFLAFTGAATNICVEATVRDAFHEHYFPILLEDACANAGPPATQEATIFNVKLAYGWVASTQSFLKLLS
jgi:ureidoacrylate peracid hydrolase